MNRNKHMYMNNVNVRSGFEWKYNFYTVRCIYKIHFMLINFASLEANATSDASESTGCIAMIPSLGV